MPVMCCIWSVDWLQVLARFREEEAGRPGGRRGGAYSSYWHALVEISLTTRPLRDAVLFPQEQ